MPLCKDHYYTIFCALLSNSEYAVGGWSIPQMMQLAKEIYDECEQFLSSETALDYDPHIRSLGFSIRTLNCLQQYMAKYLGAAQVDMCRRSWLSSVALGKFTLERGVGAKTVHELRQYCEKEGLNLKP